MTDTAVWRAIETYAANLRRARQEINRLRDQVEQRRAQIDEQERAELLLPAVAAQQRQELAQDGDRRLRKARQEAQEAHEGGLKAVERLRKVTAPGSVARDHAARLIADGVEPAQIVERAARLRDADVLAAVADELRYRYSPEDVSGAHSAIERHLADVAEGLPGQAWRHVRELRQDGERLQSDVEFASKVVGGTASPSDRVAHAHAVGDKGGGGWPEPPVPGGIFDPSRVPTRQAAEEA